MLEKYETSYDSDGNAIPDGRSILWLDQLVSLMERFPHKLFFPEATPEEARVLIDELVWNTPLGEIIAMACLPNAYLVHQCIPAVKKKETVRFIKPATEKDNSAQRKITEYVGMLSIKNSLGWPTPCY